MMKKLTLILLSTIVSLCLFTACSDDEEDNDIVGKWQYSKTVAGELKTSSATATEILKNRIYKEAEEYTYYFEFTSDGKMLSSGGDGVYKVSGNKLTITYSSSGSDIYEISISGNKLSFYFDETEYYQEEKENLGIAKDVTIDKVIEVDEYVKIK